MVRSLWTAATGMNAQQTNVDTIANNLSNVNTVGYKSQVAQFKSLLYQTLQTATTTANGDPKPTSSQVGLGVRNSSINSIFTQGSLLSSNSDTSFAIEGAGRMPCGIVHSPMNRKFSVTHKENRRFKKGVPVDDHPQIQRCIVQMH